MFLLELVVAIVSYLAARSLWHFVILRAAKDASFAGKLMLCFADVLIFLFAALSVLAVGGAVLCGGMALIDAVRR